jgi:ParB/RepB/Spo0J family partition protein
MSISQIGICVPLSVVAKRDTGTFYFLLDGFKRYRCAQNLSIHQVPVTIIGEHEVCGILRVLSNNQSSSLNSLEEALFIEELNSTHGLSYSEISRRLNRSVSWVSLRAEMIRSMSSCIREIIMSGKFPLRSYMYELVPFTRVKGGMQEVEKFVSALCGRNYSTRDISLLARAFFKGKDTVKQQILSGNCDWTLKMLKTKDTSSDTSETPITGKLIICQRTINQITEKLLENPDILSDQTVKSLSERFGQSCYYYLTVIQELEV